MKEYSFIKPDPRLQNNLMAFGYDCGPGWYPLIEELFDKIQELLNTKYPELKEDFEIIQVKEKWGLLRIYVIGANEEIYDLLDDYEDKSSHVCEMCGKKAFTKVINNWYTTICRACEIKKGEV